jgi:phage/plasmid-like protein (TIGR03299 family)
LDWEVQKQPLYTGPERDVRIKDRYVVCRTDRLDEKEGGQLAVVGKDFTPLQNREAFGFLDPVVGEGGAVYHTAGSLRGGRRIWMLAKLPGYLRVIGDDVAEKFVLLSNGHDGTAAVRIGLTPIRVVCMNTLSIALRGMGGLSIPHYPDVAKRVSRAHELLGIVNETLGSAETTMQQMARTPINTGRLKNFHEQIDPISGDDELARDRAQLRHTRWAELFEAGDGNSLPGVHGTLWAAYNGVTQWVDRDSYTTRNKEPLNTIWFGQGERIKRRAFDIAAQLASANLN